MAPPKISLAESRIMEAFWREGALSAEGVIEAVGVEQGWAPGTVRTLIARLLKKGMIVATRVEGQHCYRPLVPRDNYVRAESQNLVDRLFGGEVTPLVAHFAEHRALSASDIRDLKALIAKLANE